MSQFGGKNDKKTSSDSKRHFTVVRGDEEGGLYVSSSPSSAAKKAVTKLCVSNKSKKVEFYIREITQGSKKKTYGPYEGHIEKLKEPIELKGRVVKYKPIAKLSRKIGVKKGGMHRASGGPAKPTPKICYFVGKGSDSIFLRENPTLDSKYAAPFSGLDKHDSGPSTDEPTYLHPDEKLEIEETKTDPKSGVTFVKVKSEGVSGWIEIKYCGSTPLQTVEQARPFEFYSQGDPEYLEREEKLALGRQFTSLPAKPVRRSVGGPAKLKIIPENAQAAPSLEAARQLWQQSKQAAPRQKLKLPNIPNNMLNTNNLPNLPKLSAQRHNLPNLPKLSAQRHNSRHSFTTGASSAQRHDLNNNFETDTSYLQRHSSKHSYNLAGPSAQRHNSRHSFTNGPSSAYDEFFASVLQRANDRRVEKVSDTKYIIHYSKNHRVIMELQLLDNGTPFNITETHQNQ